MTEFRFRRLEEHRVGGTGSTMQLSYPVPRSPSGKVYRYSPNEKAAPRLFLLGQAPAERVVSEALRHRMRLEPGSDLTVCPYSGQIADDSAFVHFDDIKAIKEEIAWAVGADVQDYFAEFARSFNRRQRAGGLITLQMKTSSRREPKPVAIRTDLLRDLQCDVCQRPYAVYAIALFCPDCGSPNVALHFQREMTNVREEIGIVEQLDADGRAEIAYRLMGNAHEDVLTAFEATLKTLYRHLVLQRIPDQFDTHCSKKSIGNAFQNVERGREKFQILDIDPYVDVSADDLSFLRINFQKRHVIGHNLSLADEHYAELTQAEQPGETVRLLAEEIKRFSELCLKVIVSLENHVLSGCR
jgi:hypothetical protein